MRGTDTQMKHFDLIKCIEDQNPAAPEVKWQVCTNKLKFPNQPIKDCYDSGRGRQVCFHIHI